MKMRLVIEMETGTDSSEQSFRLADLLMDKIPNWVASSEDFENEAIGITQNDEMFEQDFSVTVTLTSVDGPKGSVSFTEADG